MLKVFFVEWDCSLLEEADEILCGSCCATSWGGIAYTVRHLLPALPKCGVSLTTHFQEGATPITYFGFDIRFPNVMCSNLPRWVLHPEDIRSME